MNGEAVYQRIARDLREKIARGDLAPGAAVPGVTALADRYEVTRVTSRRALSILTQEGLIAGGRVARHDRLPVAITRQGTGWAGEALTGGADSWGAAVLAAGRIPTQNIEVLMTLAEEPVITHLHLETPWTVIVRRLIRYVDGEPHNMIAFWFPRDVADRTLLAGPESIAEGSIAWLEKRMGPLEHSWEAHPRMPSPEEAEILRIPPGVPVEEVWRTSTAGGRPVAVSRAIYPGDRIKLTG